MIGKNITDSFIAGSAITTPLWLQNFNMWAESFIILGGSILIIIRVAVAVREWVKGGKS